MKKLIPFAWLALTLVSLACIFRWLYIAKIEPDVRASEFKVISGEYIGYGFYSGGVAVPACKKDRVATEWKIRAEIAILAQNIKFAEAEYQQTLDRLTAKACDPENPAQKRVADSECKASREDIERTEDRLKVAVRAAKYFGYLKGVADDEYGKHGEALLWMSDKRIHRDQYGILQYRVPATSGLVWPTFGNRISHIPHDVEEWAVALNEAKKTEGMEQKVQNFRNFITVTQ